MGRQAGPELAASSFQLPAGSMYGCSRGSSPGIHERSKDVEGNDFSPGEQLVSLRAELLATGETALKFLRVLANAHDFKEGKG